MVPFTAYSDTDSQNSYASSLIWAEYRKTGKIPNIIYKFEETGDSKNITKEIIDEGTRHMLLNKINIPKAVHEYYLQTRGMKVEQLLKKENPKK